MKRIKTLLIILSLSVYLPANPIVEASSESNGLTYEKTIYEQDNYLDINSFYFDDNNVINDSYMVEPNSAIGVAIFFGGVTVGWLIDDVIEYSTGRAPSEWVALGLNSIESRIRSAVASGNGRLPYVNVSSNVQVSGCTA